VKTVSAILASLLFLSPNIAFSTIIFETGNDLIEQCSQNQAFCLGYVAGVADALSASGAICAPKPVTVGQDVAIVMKYLNDHPERRRYSASSLAAVALGEQFACK
jgi:hypothetical protein